MNRRRPIVGALLLTLLYSSPGDAEAAAEPRPVTAAAFQQTVWTIVCTDGPLELDDGELVEWLVAAGYVARPAHWSMPWTSSYARSQVLWKVGQYAATPPPPAPVPDPGPDPTPPSPDPVWWDLMVCDRTYRFDLSSAESVYREFYRVEALYGEGLWELSGAQNRLLAAVWPSYGGLVQSPDNEAAVRTRWRDMTCLSRVRTEFGAEVIRRGWSTRLDLSPLESTVQEPPPSGYTVLENEYLRVGFVPEAGAVLAWLSYRGGPNLIDDSAVSSRASSGRPDRGREFQGILWEGYPPRGETATRQLCYDVVNPTPAAGNWGNSYVTPVELDVGVDYVRVLSKPYDYYNLRAGCRGPYRMARIGDIFPETTWWVRYTYRLEGRTVRWSAEWWHEDVGPRWLNHSNVVALMNPAHIQRPLENEHLRDWSSWRQDRINDNRVIALSPALGLRITFSGDLGPDTTYHGHLADWYDPYTQAEPGRANVVELGVEGTRFRWVHPHQIIRQEAVLTVEERGNPGR